VEEDDEDEEDRGLTTTSADSDPPFTVVEQPSPRRRYVAPVATSVLGPGLRPPRLDGPGPRPPGLDGPGSRPPRLDGRRLCPPGSGSGSRRSASLSAVRPPTFYRSRLESSNTDFGEPAAHVQFSTYETSNFNRSPYSITERRVPELIPVLGSQPAGVVSHKPGGRLQLLSARRAVTPATLNRAATNFAAW